MERVNPAEYGWSQSKLDAAGDYAREIDSSAIVIVQDGRVIANWGDVRRRIEIHSGAQELHERALRHRVG